MMLGSTTSVIACALRLLVLVLASTVFACNTTCPTDYVEQQGRCVKPASPADEKQEQEQEQEHALEGRDAGAPPRPQVDRAPPDGGAVMPAAAPRPEKDPPACSGASCGRQSAAPVGGMMSVAGAGAGASPPAASSCKGKVCRGKCGECCTEDDCAEKAGLVASCDSAAMRCEYACPDHKRDCHGKCIAADDCCADNECEGQHACVQDSCSSSQCVAGYRACADRSCVTATGGCCSADECEGHACVDGRCASACRGDYVTCGNGGCVPMQGACVAVVFLVPPAQDCAASLCTPERETCKTNKFRRVLRSSTDPGVLGTMCANTFEPMRQSICAEADVAGKSEIVVNYYVDLYSSDGNWSANYAQGSGTCAN